MASSSSSIDCDDYDSERCKKGKRLVFHRNELRDMIILACWGVYCQSGSRIRYKKKKDKKTGIKKTERSQVELGQTYVFNGIYNTVKDNSVSDIFFAGDNVYRYSYPPDHLLSPDEDFMGFEINKQLESFETCYQYIKPHVSRTFIAIGNHDIETCENLNQQLNYNGWQQTGVYYSVCYNSNNSNSNKHQRDVTIVVLDTNMYEDPPLKCNQEPFTEEDIQKQEEFVLSECERARKNNEWLILIGHIPAIATGHKSQSIENQRLFTLIKKCQPHLYVCGDEHNQQFIYKESISFAVVGSGGTDLDTLYEPTIDGTQYAQKNFGFLHLNFDHDHLLITFNVSLDEHVTRSNYKISIDFDRTIEI